MRDNEELLHARIVQLWQTRILRTARLTVHDEIDNALLYYRATFIREIPKLYAELERRLGRPVPTFLRMGNWIGGDRDGNPNVDAQTLDLTVRLHCETILRHYLAETHHLGADLSMSRESGRPARRNWRRWPSSPATSIRIAPTNLTAAP